jgi:hypothetical protein
MWCTWNCCFETDAVPKPKRETRPTACWRPFTAGVKDKQKEYDNTIDLYASHDPQPGDSGHASNSRQRQELLSIAWSDPFLTRFRDDPFPRSSLPTTSPKPSSIVRSTESYGREEMGDKRALLWKSTVGGIVLPRAPNDAGHERDAADVHSGKCERQESDSPSSTSRNMSIPLTDTFFRSEAR